MYIMLPVLALSFAAIAATVNAGPPANLPHLPNLFQTTTDVDNYTSTVTGNIPNW
jgi:hypothetical protein